MNLKKEITKSDIEELKLKCGLEIHQQLEGKKLFCNCPTTIRDDKPDYEIQRFLRASAGEGGKIDVAALAEMQKKKHNLYEAYNDTNCLVELDEEPPGPVNTTALQAALQVAQHLNMDIFDQIRFMRKTVVDGSNTSGFQRTGQIAANGTLQLPSGLQVGVETICLEEDSCKKIETTPAFEKYNLSRLGIPLIELATAPDMHTPQDIKTVAEHIGMIMRSLDNVKRGLGTIRQDVNISIAKGVRVEIKGAQDLKLIPTLAEYEMLRQHNLLEIFEELKMRGAKVSRDFQQITSLNNSASKVIQSALSKQNGIIYATSLKGFAGLVGLEIQPGRRYGSELSDYAKVMGVKGLFHSDELPNYGITREEKEAIFKELLLDPEKDAYLLIADEKEVARRAILAASQRAADFTLRKEVRTANPDGTSVYMRPMPGAARMYPETDVMPYTVDKQSIEPIKLLSEKISEIQKKFGLAEEMVKRLLKDGINILALAKTYSHIKPSYFVDYYYSLPKQVEKETGKPIDVTLYETKNFTLLNEGNITPEGIVSTLLAHAKGEEVNYDDYKPLSIDDIKDDVKKIVAEMKGAPMGAVMGEVMSRYQGKIDGKALSTLVRELLQ